MHANKRERIEESGAGSIVGVMGLKDSSTGDTLCTAEHPVMLEAIGSYEPVISIAVEPKTHSDQEKMDEVLAKFTAEDPTLRVRRDEDTGQTILSGMGELHLEIITSRMQREFNTNVNVGKPQVVYRETIGSRGQGTAAFDREIAGQRHYAEVTLEALPLPRGSGSRFESKLAPEVLPPAFVEAVRKGAMGAFESGPVSGYPVVDVQAPARGSDPAGHQHRARLHGCRLHGLQGSPDQGGGLHARADHDAPRCWCPKPSWARSSATSTRATAKSSRSSTSSGSRSSP